MHGPSEGMPCPRTHTRMGEWVGGSLGLCHLAPPTSADPLMQLLPLLARLRLRLRLTQLAMRGRGQPQPPRPGGCWAGGTGCPDPREGKRGERGEGEEGGGGNTDRRERVFPTLWASP